MYETAPKKAMIFSFFVYSKVNKNNEEIGLICINTIEPKKEESPRSMGWETHSYWVNFDDDLFKYLKSNLLKPCEIVITWVEDYKDSNKATAKLTKINDHVIKQ